MFDFERLCEDYNIDYKPVNRRGYVAINCCFCGDNKYKGGLHTEKGSYYCWSCSSIPIHKAIKVLTGENWYHLERNYKTVLNFRDQFLSNKTDYIQQPTSIELPPHTKPLNDRAKKYLRERGLDPYELEELYKLQSTDFLGDYPFRIIIPVYFENKLVSFTSRDYTGKAEIRYKSCPKEKELIEHKDIVYGYDLVPGNHVICVEGPADAWKMGPGSVATFGISFTQAQINLLATFFRVTLIYDNSDNARRRCDKLGEQLSGLGSEVEAIYLKDFEDPGAVPLSEARAFTKQILEE